MSGIPGSGKSTLAEKYGGIICSADHFFIGKDGTYKFDRALLPIAHNECLRKFLGCLNDKSGRDIIVDNTNTTAVEIATYYTLAHLHGLKVRLVTTVCNPETAFKRNVHDVPFPAVKRMASNIARRQIPAHWAIEEEFINTNE
jgi:hypothetical protein